MPVLSKDGRLVSSNSKVLLNNNNTIEITLYKATSFTILFTISSSGIVIDWGDGVKENHTNGGRSHTYNNAGTYYMKISGNITSITYFQVNNSAITNINNFKTGTLSYLEIAGTSIPGVLDLSQAKVGTTVVLNSNSLMTNVKFASNNNLVTVLYLYSCNITSTLDLSNVPISGNIRLYSNSNMTNILFKSTGNSAITTLNIDYCNITVLDLTYLMITNQFTIYINPGLTSVIFSNSGNAINGNTWYMSVGGNLDYANMLGVSLASNSWKIHLEMNSMSASEVNHMLVDLYSLVSGEPGGGSYTGRIIYIGGTNADPDGSSGGYDGVTARNNLIAKGIIVNI